LISVVLSCNEDSIFAEAMYKTLSARGVTGFINISQGFSDAFYQNFSLEENVNTPLIFLDVIDAQTHSITIDTPGAIGLAVNHLLDHGYREIALVNCPEEWPVGREALRGFCRALKARGIATDTSRIYTVPNFGYEAGRFVIERMLISQSLPRALVTVSDNLAIGAISALKKHSIQVPEDVAVIGFNDIETASIVDPPLSTISLPLFDMGQQTMSSLLEHNRYQTVLSGNTIDTSDNLLIEFSQRWYQHSNHLLIQITVNYFRCERDISFYNRSNTRIYANNIRFSQQMICSPDCVVMNI